LGVNRGWGKEVAEGEYLDEVVEDGLKVLVGAVVEGIHYFAALEADQYHVKSQKDVGSSF
jgi:hypothetical protein